VVAWRHGSAKAANAIRDSRCAEVPGLAHPPLKLVHFFTPFPGRFSRTWVFSLLPARSVDDSRRRAIRMASKYKDKDAGVVVAFNGSWVSWLHTAAAYGKILDPANATLSQSLTAS
jgi:hypothetical protein